MPKPKMKTETSSKIRELLPILALTYDATKKGWTEFQEDALIAHRVGYELVTVAALGTQSFGVVWRLAREQRKNYDDFFGDDDDVPAADPSTILLR